MSKDELLAEAKCIGDLMQGCSDGYCKFGGPRKGMHTNAGCKCQAEPGYNRSGPYGDIQYMATLLGLIAEEFK